MTAVSSIGDFRILIEFQVTEIASSPVFEQAKEDEKSLVEEEQCEEQKEEEGEEVGKRKGKTRGTVDNTSDR